MKVCVACGNKFPCPPRIRERSRKVKNNLKSLRKKSNLTQEALGQAIGSNKQYICRLENGTRALSNIRMETAMKICEALHCSLDELIGG